MKTEITDLFLKIIRDKFNVDVNLELLKSDPKYGDFSTNVALKLANVLGKTPEEIANTIILELEKLSQNLLTNITFSAPGFINFKLADEILLNDNYLSKNNFFSNQTIVIETNNPNPFKSMHVGHALNAVIGDTIANLLEFGGGKVHRVSYHGDIGTHVGKSMWSILKYLDGDLDKLNQLKPDDRNNFMSRMYAEGSKAYDESEEIKAEIIELTKKSYKLEDDFYYQVYSICKKWSFEDLDIILEKLGSKPVEKRYLESEAYKIGFKIVNENIGRVFTKSDSAIIFRGEDYHLFTVVFISSTGNGLYAARDLGLIKLKENDFAPDKSYIITDNGQKDYFKVIFKASELLNITTSDETININTGLVKLSTGKMSSREGKVLDINWLVDQVSGKLAEHNENFDNKLIAGAIRYQLLKVKLGGDIVFDIDQSVSLQGNTGPYLMYAHARARSILGKAVQTNSVDEKVKYIDAERGLALKLFDYESILNQAVAELKPNIACNYLYELSQEFNQFYEHNKVLGSERQSIRLKLVNKYADVLRHGLNILGIFAPDKM